MEDGSAPSRYDPPPRLVYIMSSISTPRKTMRTTPVALPLLIMLAACQTVPVHQSERTAPAVGAPTAHAAVAMYMTAMRESNLTLIGNIWGTRDELARKQYSRAEFEKRAFITSCYLGWDGYRITAERPAADDARMVTVRSTNPGHVQQTTLRLEESSRGRWFVEGTDLTGLRPVNCRESQKASAGR